ncbi:MAG: hypothetical protein B7Z06_04910 [Flavobacteriales bacterium 32-35-8]|nr:MAG: hypothetical protein B7Z06_04910 [Flavobacteriales bacterium 32-35-8]
MDFTDRQTDIINIILSKEKANLSEIRSLLTENISIPTLNRELDKLIYHKIIQKIGRGRTKAYALSPMNN